MVVPEKRAHAAILPAGTVWFGCGYRQGTAGLFDLDEIGRVDEDFHELLRALSNRFIR